MRPFFSSFTPHSSPLHSSLLFTPWPALLLQSSVPPQAVTQCADPGPPLSGDWGSGFRNRKKMNSTTEKLIALRVIPVLRLATRPGAESAIDCLVEAGFKTVELTLTTPGAIELIAWLRRRTGEDFLVGAGTVLDLGHREGLPGGRGGLSGFPVRGEGHGQACRRCRPGGAARRLHPDGSAGGMARRRDRREGFSGRDRRPRAPCRVACDLSSHSPVPDRRHFGREPARLLHGRCGRGRHRQQRDRPESAGGRAIVRR